MFTIRKTNKRGASVTITHIAKPAFKIELDNLDELTQLYTTIDQYLADHRVGEFIGSAQAQAIAAEQGYNIPITTLVNACTRGTIPAAHKRRGRWYMPRANFDAWFEEWKAKQAER